jgi:hypothetical protein
VYAEAWFLAQVAGWMAGCLYHNAFCHRSSIFDAMQGVVDDDDDYDNNG